MLFSPQQSVSGLVLRLITFCVGVKSFVYEMSLWPSNEREEFFCNIYFFKPLIQRENKKFHKLFTIEYKVRCVGFIRPTIYFQYLREM